METFCRIPFFVVNFLALLFSQALTPDASFITIAVIAICLFAVAYTADIIRGGIESVLKTLVEVAQAMNTSRLQAKFRIVLPRAWFVIIPPAIDFAMSFIKDTALVSKV